MITPQIKDIISQRIYDTVLDLFTAEEDFFIVINNHNNWDLPLPERLATKDMFMLDISKQLVLDSYIENDRLIIVTTFDEIVYCKVLEPEDVQVILASNGKTQLIVKPFKETPELVINKKDGVKFNIPKDEELIQSMAAMKRNNPNLFKD